MKKTVLFIARALPCPVFKGFFRLHQIQSRSNSLPNTNTANLDSGGVKFLALLSGSELKLELLRRKSIIFSVIALLTTVNSLYAQQKLQASQLIIGDKIPNITLSDIINYPKTQIQFSELKGRALILDFWATHCGPCIKKFPKMDSLQKHFGKNLQFLLINSYPKDTDKILSDFLTKEKSKIPEFSLPIVPSDSVIRKVFPVNIIPHYIWIGADGRIKAITDAEELTAANIERLIAGLSLNLKLKRN